MHIVLCTSLTLPTNFSCCLILYSSTVTNEVGDSRLSEACRIHSSEVRTSLKVNG